MSYSYFSSKVLVNRDEGDKSDKRDNLALDKVNLSVSKGEIHGLIGPDSAGKTTLMRLLCGLLPIQTGEATVFDKPVRTEFSIIRASIGYMPQRFSLYQDLTVEENLLFFARLFGVSKAERDKLLPELYGFSRLEKFKTRRAGALSGGMKQKLALTCALIHRPPLLILDEPTYGVDPVSRQEFWHMLKSIQQDGTSILVSTPYMDEAELCDRITLLFNGKVLAADTPAAIKAAFNQAVYVVSSDKIRALATVFEAMTEIDSCQLFGNELHLIMSAAKAQSVFSHPALAKADGAFNWHQTQPNMEDIFLSYMKHD